MQGPTMSAKFVIICLPHSSAFADSLQLSLLAKGSRRHALCRILSYFFPSLIFYEVLPELPLTQYFYASFFSNSVDKRVCLSKVLTFLHFPTIIASTWKGQLQKTNHSLNMKQKQWLLAILCLYHFFLSNLINVDGLGVSVTLTVQETL